MNERASSLPKLSVVKEFALGFGSEAVEKDMGIDMDVVELRYRAVDCFRRAQKSQDARLARCLNRHGRIYTKMADARTVRGPKDGPNRPLNYSATVEPTGWDRVKSWF